MVIDHENGQYVGQVSNGQKNFWGVFVWTAGQFKDCMYMGEFVQNSLHGRGILFYNNGRIY